MPGSRVRDGPGAEWLFNFEFSGDAQQMRLLRLLRRPFTGFIACWYEIYIVYKIFVNQMST